MSKLFWDIREEHELMEKLRASDPTGKWISDFVHSDNPKFAGKSKKERIRMALGAAYAAKRQNEDNNHIVEKYTENDIANGGTVIYKHDGKHYMSKVSHKTGAGAGTKIHTTSALGHVVPLHHVVSTDASDWNTYKNRPVKEEVEIDEAAWGQDKMANLKAAHDRHSEKAIAANRAGDDAAVKVHQSKMNMIKNQMNKLRKEDVEQVDEAKHRISVTVSEPDHPMVTKRKEQQQKFIRVGGDKEGAVARAQQHYKKQGYKVHGAEYVGGVNEDIEQVDELRTSTLLRYATKANKSLIGGDRNKEEKRIKGIQKANYKIQTRHSVKEDAEQINELSSATLKSYIGKATRSIEQKKKDVGKYDRFSKDPRRGPVAKSINAKISSRIGQEAKRRATNIGKAAMKLASEESVNETPAYTKDDAYSGFGSIKPHRTLKVANVLKPEKDATARAERLMAKAGVRTNEAKSLYDRHQELRKKSGLPDPSYYLKKMKEKQAEIEALRNQGSTEHLHGISHDAHPGAQKTFAGQVKK